MRTSSLRFPRLAALAFGVLAVVAACGPGSGPTGRPGGPIQTPAGSTPETDVVTSPNNGGGGGGASPGGGGGLQSTAP